MFPVEILERIASNLGAADRARFACVSKNTREAVSRTVCDSISAIVPESVDGLKSFADLIVRNANDIEYLRIVINVVKWKYVWRYVNICAPKLRLVIIEHRTSDSIVLKSPEDYFPWSPKLEEVHLISCYGNMHIGEGFSRLKVQKLTVGCGKTITSDTMTWMIPTVDDVYIYGLVPHWVEFTGLAFSKLRKMECPASLMRCLRNMPYIETLTLHGTIDDGDIAQEALLPRLKHLRLQGGNWPSLRWVPGSLETLEVAYCTHLPDLRRFQALKELRIHATPCNLDAGIHTLELRHFKFRSCDTPFFPFIVFSQSFDIYSDDAEKITCYEPRV